MKVGCPTEIKTDEYRVGLTPAGVRELVEHGHEVLIQRGAGEGSAIDDAQYEAQGARILPDARTVFAEATPGTPPRRIPRPPSGFSSMKAPACVAILPATSLIGASSGSRPRASVTVS